MAKMEMGIFFKILLLVVVECIMDSDSQSTEVIFKDPNATLRNFDADKLEAKCFHKNFFQKLIKCKIC